MPSAPGSLVRRFRVEHRRAAVSKLLAAHRALLLRRLASRGDVLLQAGY